MPEDDFNALLEAVVPFAQAMLRRYGEFFPFGATMRSDGEIQQAAAQSEVERPQSIDLMNMMADDFEA